MLLFFIYVTTLLIIWLYILFLTINISFKSISWIFFSIFLKPVYSESAILVKYNVVWAITALVLDILFGKYDDILNVVYNPNMFIFINFNIRKII